MKERYAREIINGFPYPIATVFIRLRTDECMDPGPLRLKYLLATGEAIARFLGVITLCECRRVLEQGEVAPPKSLAANFKAQFSRPSWGIWLQFVREGSRWLADNDVTPTITELPGFLFTGSGKESDAARAMAELLTVRNGLSHEKLKALHPGEFRQLCDRVTPLLEEVLEGLDFLLDYELKFVSAIEVLKPRRRDAAFRHRFKRIIGSSDDFHGDRHTMPAFHDSTAIILASLEGGHSLNLDPLLIHEENAGKAPDIFFYNGMKASDKAEYAACKHGGNFTATDLEPERAGEIGDELAAFVALFGTPQEENGHDH
ncbi:MAG: hypothetical protein WC943_16100 [Elusimicrobiota bacterium]